MTRARTGRARTAAALAALGVAAGLSACGGSASSPPPAPPARPAAASPHGTAFLQAATCADWNRAGPAERRATTRALTAAATSPDPENHGATLTDEQAARLFARACSTPASTPALLYEIYNRAAAFQTVYRGTG